jgi:transcription elongation factor Elf1
MHRIGADPQDMLPTDFLCDFCGAHYSDDRPMVEGHRGSLICSRCLAKAHTQVIEHNAGITVPEHIACALCLMNKSGDYYQSPIRATATPDGAAIDPTPGACACRWCIERSAKLLADSLR